MESEQALSPEMYNHCISFVQSHNNSIIMFSHEAKVDHIRVNLHDSYQEPYVMKFGVQISTLLALQLALFPRFRAGPHIPFEIKHTFSAPE